MKKLLTIFAALVLTAGVFGLTDHSDAAAQESTGAAARESIGAQLVLPQTHEQYLDLQNPSDIAENGEYIAIADGNTVWLYDKADKSYSSYTQQGADSVTSLNFYQEGGETLLYFAADMSGSNPILWISCDAPAQATETQIKSCATFLIYGTDVYFANAQNSVFYTTMSGRDILAPDGSGNITPANEASNLTPSFAQYGGKIYFSWNKNIFLANKNNSSQHANATYNISSFVFTANGCYYLSTEGYLYKQGSNPDVRVATMQESEFDKICNTQKTYLICGNCIRAFSPETEEYTGYEIARYSDSANRLSKNASDVSVYGNTLFFADTAQNRVLCVEDGVYSSLTLTYSPARVCAGEEALAVYGSGILSFYVRSEGGYTAAGRDEIAGIVGIAYADGQFYLAASDGKTYSYSLQGGAYSRAKTGNLSLTPGDLASDLYGNLYVMAAEGTVYKYDATSFFAPPATLTIVTQISGAKRILSDYRGDLYALTGDSLVRYDVKEGTLRTYDLSPALSLVYNPEGSHAVSFALGFESGEVYILSDAFAAVTSDADVASLDNLSAAEAYRQIYTDLPQEDCAQDILVRANAGCVTVMLDLDALSRNPSVLPCGKAERMQETRTGVVLAQTEYGVLVLFYNYSTEGVATARSYELRLLLEGSDYELLGTQYYTEQGYNATLSNGVGLYRFPVLQTGSGDNLQPFGVTERLEGGEHVYVLGELAPEQGVLDTSSYSVIRVTRGEQVLYGFVPTAYLVEAGESSVNSAEFVYRELKKDSVVTLGGLTLENEEKLKVYGEADEDGMVFVSYKDAEGKVYTGTIRADLLKEPDNSILAVLIIVPLVTAAVLVSVCYLVLRKQPTLQS